ncbi:MAG: WD40 repeat domain-containing protein, partial [Gemmataceae bacterium]
VDPVNPGRHAAIAHLPGPIGGLLAHPDGDFILAACDNMIHILDPFSGSPIRPPIQFKYPLRGYSLSRDGSHLAIGGRWNQYAVWDTTNWEKVQSFENLKQSFGFVGFLANGAILAGELNGKVSIREAQTGKLLAGFQLPCTLNCAALSPDGNTLAIGSMQRGLRLVDSMTGIELMKPFILPEPAVEIVWHPDGHSIFARNTLGMVRQFDTATLRPIGPPIAERASSLAVSREGGVVWIAHPRHVFSRAISDE